MSHPGNDTGAGAGQEFHYPGSIGQYLRQAFVSVSLAFALSFLLILLVMIVDRFFLNGEYVKPAHLAMVTGLAALWGMFAVQMALSLARFSLVIENGTLLVYRGTRTVSIPFSGIVSVEIMSNPAWWALRADLKPLKDTARHMVRINRDAGPPVTFAGGLVGEEKLIQLIQMKIDDLGKKSSMRPLEGAQIEDL
ncbi:MAG: hypothetical protein GXP52_04950 [Deltaproteobacteria bacterium]|nr:hypothetical protein [Deltaproteobacteria bacterium]